MTNFPVDYSWLIASIEVGLLLLLGFFSGALLRWLLLLIIRSSNADSRREKYSKRREEKLLKGESTEADASTDYSLDRLVPSTTTVVLPDELSKTDSTDSGAPIPAQVQVDAPPPMPQADVPSTETDVFASIRKRAEQHKDGDKKDPLKKIMGLGGSAEQLLQQMGVTQFGQLASLDRDSLRALLDAGDKKLKFIEPKSWPRQAELAQKGEWARLKEYQQFLLEKEQL